MNEEFDVIADIAERAVKTFLQAAVGTALITGSISKTALVAAIAAGLSAVGNYLMSLNNIN